MERMRNKEKRHWKREHKLKIERMRKSKEKRQRDNNYEAVAKTEEGRESIDFNGENEKLGEETMVSNSCKLM